MLGWVVPDRRGPVPDDPPYDAYALVPIELNWTKYGKTPGDNIAYYNPATRVKITHFPVIHCRKGSVGYKLEWNGLSMIYTGDTKPEYHSVQQAAGVNVFIHEMNPRRKCGLSRISGCMNPPKKVGPRMKASQILSILPRWFRIAPTRPRVLSVTCSARSIPVHSSRLPHTSRWLMTWSSAPKRA